MFRGIDPERSWPVNVVGMTVQPIGSVAAAVLVIPRRNSALLDTQSRGAKQIQITFALLCGPDRVQAVLDKLNAWAWGGEGDLQLHADERRCYRAALQATSTAEYGVGSRVTYTFVAPRGLKYGPPVKRALPGAAIYVGGTAETPLRLSCTLAREAERLTWSNGVQHVTLAGRFAAGGTVRLDSEEELAVWNGQNAMRFLTYDSRFFGLRPGRNALTGPGGTLEYREAWL